MKLNLGCGNDIRLGYINVDKKKTHPSVIVDNITVLSGISESSADEITAINVLQYIGINQLQLTIRLWISKLIKGGRLYIESTDSNMLGTLMAFNNIQVNEFNNLLYSQEDKYIALYNLTVLNDILSSENMQITQKGYNGYNFYIEAIKNG